MLRLDAEQEAGREIEDVDDARSETGFLLVGRKVLGLEVAVREGDQPPDDGETEPGEQEGCGEDDERPTPLGVDERREDVLQEAEAALRTTGLEDVALAVFEDGAATDLADCAWSKGFSGKKGLIEFLGFLVVLG